MLKIRGPVVSKDLFWCLQFTLQVELHTGLSKTSASVGCGSHVRFVKLMTLSKTAIFVRLEIFTLQKLPHFIHSEIFTP